MIDRRGFFAGTGLATTAVLAAERAQAAPPAANVLGRSVLDFGVEANTERDQSAALQRALNEIAASGQPAFLPPGMFETTQIKIPAGCALTGVSKQSVLRIKEWWELKAERSDTAIKISNLIFSHAPGLPSPDREQVHLWHPVLGLKGGQMVMENCTISNTLHGVHAESASIQLVDVSIDKTVGHGVEAVNSTVNMHRCNINGCWIGVKAGGVDSTSGQIIAQNTVTNCKSEGINVAGRAIVTANMISGCGYGLKLGDPRGKSHILTSQNSIKDCRVGIAAEAEGDYIVISLNVIEGAKDGAIRAVADGKLTGPDLAQQSAEAFRNLIVAGNVPL